MSSSLYIGLMSGTSLDGVDAVLADFARDDPLVSACFAAFPDDLRRSLQQLVGGTADELDLSAVTTLALSRLYASAAAEVMRAAQVDAADIRAIGCHGQTIRHRPEVGYTIQLAGGAVLAELTRCTVVCDFRSRDVAAGGQGAPLVPAFHAARFRHPAIDRVVVNLGGIANLTCLPAAGPVTGFDSGPGNGLLDEWAERHLGERFDEDGAWSAGGTVSQPLLDALAGDPYFTLPPPKSTGRDRFTLQWVLAHIDGGVRPQDVQATLCELTARTVAEAIRHHAPDAQAVYVCGGGAHNLDLMTRLGRRLGSVPIQTTAALGVDPDWVEALAFAWLAHRTLAGQPGNLPEVTGASGSRILGCIYPA